ncbi:hypothetical protein AQUCO_11300006v1 [Aquilegia coerulea]|uniref:Uncharacterized protein n=1 Tax=Aquilegia coerulea TaxID=218851 RepID=A0A2G5C2H6_AQUCA|nr:hypothetical protein AQUCO_11300006v1 [Aquilegia coerulea]
MVDSVKKVEDSESELVSSIREKLQTLPPLSIESCIYMVPSVLRSVNELAYSPKVVSIGPLHRGKEELLAMEVHKQRYLKDFLDQNAKISLEECVKSLQGLEEKARSYYAEPICLSSNDFVEMMLLDGCFVLELFLRDKHPKLRNRVDPIFKNSRLPTWVYNDLFLVENQLPFFVIEHLYSLSNGCSCSEQYTSFSSRDKIHTEKCSFLELTLGYFNYFGSYINRSKLLLPKKSDFHVNHFLHLLQISYQPSEARLEPKGNGRLEFIPSATELHEAGIKFKKLTGVKSFMDVKFTNGVLEIPYLHIGETTYLRFPNIIAMEQCGVSKTTYFTDYCLLMACLINSSSDVKLLKGLGIIGNFVGCSDNWVCSKEEVSRIFDKLCKGIRTKSETFYYRRLFEDVDAHYNAQKQKTGN